MTSRDRCCSTNEESVDAYNCLSSVYDDLIPDPPGFVEFYKDLCGSEPCRVLDVGCGTGRLLEILARNGHECVGVDPSVDSLKVARGRLLDRGLRCELKVDRLPELTEVTDKFDVILVAGGTFEYLLTTQTQILTLKRLSKLLLPGGRIALDVSIPPFVTKNPRGNYTGSFDGNLAGELKVQSSEVRLGYDHFRQLVRSACTFNFEGNRDPLHVEYTTRYITYSEWQLLLEVAQLRGQIFGDYQEGPVTRESSNFVVLAERGEL